VQKRNKAVGHRWKITLLIAAQV